MIAIRRPTLVALFGAAVLWFPAAPAAAQTPPPTTQPASSKKPALPAKPVARAAQVRQIGVPKPTVTLKPGEVPAIEFETPMYDFGKAREGTSIRYDFWFTNTGTGPLELLRVKPSCGCTTAGQYDRIVQPGKRGKIPIKLSTARLHGTVKKTVTINTNAPGDAAVVRLRIRGQVWQALSVSPRNANFGRLSQEMIADQQPKRVLTIVNNMETPAKLTNVRSSEPGFSATVKAIEPGKKFELTVTANPSLRPKANSGTIEIDTGLSEKPTLKIPTSAYITAAVDVMPPQLTLVKDRSRPMVRSFYVRNNTKEPVTLSDLTASNPKIKTTLQETHPGKSFRIMVELPAGYVLPEGGDRITVKTSNPKVPLITIPIRELRTNRPVVGTPGNPKVTPYKKTAARPTPAAKPARTDSKQKKPPQ